MEAIMFILIGILIGTAIGAFAVARYVLSAVEKEAKEEENKKVMYFCSVRGYTF